MLSFFRINDPYRLVPVFIILLLIRIPYMVDLTNVTFYEIKWMALGSKLSNGASMFIDVWDNTAPLSAGIFWILDEVFGRSHFVYYFFGLILVTYQCALFNSYVIRNNTMQENTYLLAFVYGILMSLSEEFMLLSPLLIGLTFFILSLNNIFGQIQIRAKRDEKIMIIGIYMGLATMCHFVYLIFFIGVILTLMIFSGTVLRRYLLMITGFFIPIILVALYYLMIDGLSSMLQFGTTFSWSLGTEWYLTKSTFWILIGFPLLLLLLSFLKLAGRSRLSNYQSRLLQSMILFLLLGSACFWGFADKSLHPLILVVPSLAYLITQYFLLLKRGILNELWFMITVVVITLSSYIFHYGWFGLGSVIDNQTLIVSENRSEFEDKSVLILGSDWGIIRKADHVTPFFNWRIASELFQNLDYYDNQSIVLEEVMKASPDFIIDKSEIYPLLESRFPAIRTDYGGKNNSGVYRRRD